MIIEAILQLEKGLNAANVNKVFNLTLKSFLDRDHSNTLCHMCDSRGVNLIIWRSENAVNAFQNVFYSCSSYLKGIPPYSKYLYHKFEDNPLRDMVRLKRNGRKYLYRFIGFESPLWLSDLSAAQITVSALFFIHFCVLNRL